jgi:hypothetical protein
MTYPNGAIVGTKERPDEDDENFYFTVVGEGRAYSVAVAANPDDEEDEPFVLLFGPFKTQQEAEKYYRAIERGNPRKTGDFDTVPDTLRNRVFNYIGTGVKRLKNGVGRHEGENDRQATNIAC